MDAVSMNLLFTCAFLIYRWQLSESQATDGAVYAYKAGKDLLVSSQLPAVNDSDEQSLPPVKEKKKVGDTCSYLYDCHHVNAICSFGICTCAPGYYTYYSSVCRQKRKFNETCSQHNDCKAHDANSLCGAQRCRCVESTHFIKSHGKCYKSGLQKGEPCKFDEQCHVYHGFKCQCFDFCRCISTDNSGNPIKIQNILIGIFASMAFLIGMQLIILFVRKKIKGSQQPEQQHLHLERVEPVGAVPSAPMEVLFSQVTSQAIPYNNGYGPNISESQDLPPSYEDICKNKNSIQQFTFRS